MKITRHVAVLLFIIANPILALPAQKPIYVELSEVFPAQVRYSNLNVLDKIAKFKADGDADCKDTQCTFKYDNGKSLLAESDALPVVKAPFGYVLLDGHHDTISSLRMGAKTIPIIVKKDLSHLNEQAFWEASAKEGMTYPYAIGGKWQIPGKSFDDLVNDPNRYFVAIAVRKCKSPTEAAAKTRGYEYPLWVKVGTDKPFIEFEISDLLHNHGFTYDEENGKKDFDNYVEKARGILLKNEVPQLKLIKSRQNYLEIKDLCGTQSSPTISGASESF